MDGTRKYAWTPGPLEEARVFLRAALISPVLGLGSITGSLGNTFLFPAPPCFQSGAVSKETRDMAKMASDASAMNYGNKRLSIERF